MTKPAFRLAAMGALALLYSAAPIGQAQAAEGHDNCDAFIALTGTISAPGTYCLKAGITSTLTSGAAITIAADNVTIDCNGHVIKDATTDGLATGIKAETRDSVTVRNCRIAGFRTGIKVFEGSGHLIEGNLVTNSRETGISVWNTSNSDVRRNRVMDVVSSNPHARGIEASANVIDNTVSGVKAKPDPLGGSTSVEGIFPSGIGNQVRGNRVRGLSATTAYGIYPSSSGVVISDNHVVGPGEAGIMSGICVANTVSGFNSSYRQGCVGLDNL